MDEDQNVSVVAGQVVVTQTQEVRVAAYESDDLDRELADISSAIADIDNFKERRLQNLMDRKGALEIMKAMLASEHA